MSKPIAPAADPSEDKYLWLEQTYESKALAWAVQRTATAKAALGGLPIYPQLRSELDDAVRQHTPSPWMVFIGDKLARVRSDRSHPHGILELATRDAEGNAVAWRTVFDVGAFNAAEGKTYELNVLLFPMLSLPPYERCLLPLAPAGGDEFELREFDLMKGAFVEGGFRTGASYTSAVWLTEDRILIAHTLGDAPRTAGGREAAQAYLWNRGTALEDARPVLRLDPSDAFMWLDAIGTGTSRRAIVMRNHDGATFSYAIVDQDGGVNEARLPRKLRRFPLLAVTERHFFVPLAADAEVGGEMRPAESIIAYDVHPDTPDGDRASFVYACSRDEFMDVYGFAGTKNEVHFNVDRNLQRHLLTAYFDQGAWHVRERMVAPQGTTLDFVWAGVSGNRAGQEVCLKSTGFLSPTRFELLASGKASLTIYQDTALIDADKFVVETRTATSRDGMKIDYYLLRSRTLKNPGATPTLMTGYGGFGVSLSPGYFTNMVGGLSLKLWLDRGGALAVPLIRGGGERGQAWHSAGMLEKRQNSYDDFIAAAEDLIARGFTRPQNLGVFGSSNGGLLAGAVGVQRPDLFGAVVSDAPVLDMLRYHKMGIGAGMITEFGDPEDPLMRKALLSYSPYHNLHAGREYPPFLVTVATTDDRVDPASSRKFVARGEEIGARIWLIEEPEGGHGVSDPLTHPELMTMRMAFFINALMPGER